VLFSPKKEDKFKNKMGMLVLVEHDPLKGKKGAQKMKNRIKMKYALSRGIYS